MTCMDGGIPVEVHLPDDRMIVDRIRRRASRTYLMVRAAALAPLRLSSWRRPRIPSPSQVRRLLIVRTDRLGDMALTTASIQDLRHHFRRAEITVLAPPGPLALLEAHPAVDRRIPLTDSGLPDELVGQVDLAIDFTPDCSLRGALLAARSRAPVRTGFRGGGREAFFNLKGARPDPRRHIVDINRDLLKELNVQPLTPYPSLFITSEEKAAALSRVAALGAASPRIAFHPGGFYSSQRWSPECFAEVIWLLTGSDGAACVVVGGSSEEEEVRRICAATPDALAAAPGTVRELMATLAVCDLFIGNNSGPLHIAAALGLPTVSVMGPTSLDRFAPRGPADRIIRRNLPCSPCGRGRCWHHTCLRSIDPQEVHEEAVRALRSPLRREMAR
jgi:ADP-heptose:LPS heptosyltransferase